MESSEITFFTRRKVDSKSRYINKLSLQRNNLPYMDIPVEHITPPAQLLFDSQMSAFQSAANDDDDVMRIIRTCDSHSSSTSNNSNQSPKSITSLESWSSFSNYGPLCTRCGRPTGDDSIFIKSLPFHHRHFTCRRCNVPLSFETASECDGEIFCQNCASLQSGKESSFNTAMVCNACGSPKGSTSIVVGGKCFCKNHFRCATCNCELDIDKFVQKDGLYYCLKHEPQRPKNICGKCGAEVEERAINALGKVYHPGCFSCALCNRSLANQPYTAWKNEPICRECFKKLPKHIRQAISKMAMKAI